jgi:hypothetical protein
MNADLIARLRRCAKGGLPDWAAIPFSPAEVRAILGAIDSRPDVARIAELETLLGEVLRTFVHPGHPGRACLQSGWIPVEQVARWRSALKTGGEGGSMRGRRD